MGEARTLGRIVPGKAVTDGGGVKVRRTLGGDRLAMLDPILLVDELKSATQGDLDQGLPQHPHRGIETLTYVLSGRMEVTHSMGHRQMLQPGSAQWTTAASGIVHSEMPLPGEAFRAVQVWWNLPRAAKMDPPAVHTLATDVIPHTIVGTGASVRVVAGSLKGLTGPISGGATRPLFADVTLSASSGISLDIPRDKTAVLYVLEGQGMFGITGTSTGEMIGRGHLIELTTGDEFKVLSAQAGCRFLVMGAVPIGEPVCRYGPIVMTTPEEIEIAVSEYHAGSFVRHPLVS